MLLSCLTGVNHLVFERGCSHRVHRSVVQPRWPTSNRCVSLFTNAKNVACLDWTQRRHRLAGAAGKELLTAMTNKRWIEPGNRPRASHITQTGRQHITDTDSLTPP